MKTRFALEEKVRKYKGMGMALGATSLAAIGDLGMYGASQFFENMNMGLAYSAATVFGAAFGIGIGNNLGLRFGLSKIPESDSFKDFLWNKYSSDTVVREMYDFM